jgi:hypothetical protein
MKRTKSLQVELAELQSDLPKRNPPLEDVLKMVTKGLVT